MTSASASRITLTAAHPFRSIPVQGRVGKVWGVEGRGALRRAGVEVPITHTTLTELSIRMLVDKTQLQNTK